MKKIKSYLILIFVLLLTGFSFTLHGLGIEVTGKVIQIVDGNTIKFHSTDNEIFSFLLAGIDCPELAQEFGNEAKDYLDRLLKGKVVILVIEGKDRLGNKIGSLKLAGGQDPRIELLKRGLAWTQEKSPNQEFENLKEEARMKGKGLWKEENPVAPWIFRRQQSMAVPKMG